MGNHESRQPFFNTDVMENYELKEQFLNNFN